MTAKTIGEVRGLRRDPVQPERSTELAVKNGIMQRPIVVLSARLCSRSKKSEDGKLQKLEDSLRWRRGGSDAEPRVYPDFATRALGFIHACVGWT